MMHTNALCSSIVWLPPRGARGSRSPTRALHGYTYAFPQGARLCLRHSTRGLEMHVRVRRVAECTATDRTAQVGRDMALLHRPPLAHGASFLRC